MYYVLNLVYLFVAVLISPWLLYKAITTGKYRQGMWQKLSGASPIRQGDAPCVWFHGVSVGEMHMLRRVVRAFRKRHPHCEIVVSSTTNTGIEEARKQFPDLTVFYWPLDFTWSVSRTLQRLRPNLVVLAESELWPDFLRLAKKAAVKVSVINGRMSPRSARRFRKFRWLTKPLFAGVDLWLMQTEDYADGVRQNGINKDKVHVTGNIKYDGVEINRRNSRSNAFRLLFSIHQDDVVWVAGSTQAPEEEITVRIFEQLRPQFPNLRLILIPRQKERFIEVAQLLKRMNVAFERRSDLRDVVTDRSQVILVDTIGELADVWGLADIAFVGGSLDGRRGGQNMIEPAAYGSAVLFGPHVWNFRQTVDQLLELNAAIQITDADALEQQVIRLLNDAEERQALGNRAKAFVTTQQGATVRTIDWLTDLLSTTKPISKVA